MNNFAKKFTCATFPLFIFSANSFAELMLTETFPYTSETLKIDFSQPGQGKTAALPNPTPGTDPGLMFFSEITYAKVHLRSVAENGNIPGLSYGFTYTSPYSRNVQALYPGLGTYPYTTSILIDFSEIGGVLAFGARWGSIQAPEPCCVQQNVAVTYTDGTTDSVSFSGYWGERSENDFSGIISTDKPIRTVILNQAGHSAILDDVTYNKVPSGTYYPILDGAIKGLNGTGVSVVCTNKSTNQTVTVNDTKYDCIAAGLKVKKKQKIHIEIDGLVK